MAAAVPSSAGAASVAVTEYSVDDSSTCARVPGACDFFRVDYVAAPGERNDVTLTGGGDRITVRDAGAQIAAGTGCELVDPYEARCTAPENFHDLAVKANDQDDRVANTTALDSLMDGGAGDDLLRGGRVSDTLRAGPGRDRLLGNGGGDELSDGKDDRAIEPDVFAGGGGYDAVSYRTRTRRVRVHLGDSGFDAGENGEGDRLSGIDSVRGGSGNDVLLGSSRGDLISGGAGRDRIRGGAGDDHLYGDSGADRLFGGAGPDSLDAGAGPDALVGGCGNDQLWGDGGDDRMYTADGHGDYVVGLEGTDMAVVDARRDELHTVERVLRARPSGGCGR